APAVIAAAGISFGILVRQHRALRLEHSLRDDVLGRDQLDLVLLPRELTCDGAIDLRIDVGQVRSEEAVGDGAGRSVYCGHVKALSLAGTNFAGSSHGKTRTAISQTTRMPAFTIFPSCTASRAPGFVLGRRMATADRVRRYCARDR